MTQAKKRKSTSKKKWAKTIPTVVVHILATYNNTIVTVTDMAGAVIVWESAGSVEGGRFHGSRQGSAVAATIAGQCAGRKVRDEVQAKEAEVRIKGSGAGREGAVRGLHASGLQITEIKDVTPTPHNGCRQQKLRRA